MAENPTVEETLILNHAWAIKITARRLAEKLVLRRFYGVRSLLGSIAEEAAKIESLMDEHPVLGAYREGYTDALNWVLTLDLEPNVEDAIKEALDS